MLTVDQALSGAVLVMGNLADNETVKALARLFQVVGVPLAGFLAFQVWADIQAIKGQNTSLLVQLAKLEQRADTNHGRITALEAQLLDLLKKQTVRP